jgi:hypothetical protein
MRTQEWMTLASQTIMVPMMPASLPYGKQSSDSYHSERPKQDQGGGKGGWWDSHKVIEI